MLGLHGLLKQDVVEWISTMTYQAASGAGAKNMKELIAQMGFLAREAGELINDKSDVLLLDEKITGLLNDGRMPKENFGHALAANLLPYIDSELPSGQSREEWKSMAEANKILGRKVAIPIDGTCVRTGTMRCHAQAVTIKLKKSIPLPEIEGMIKSANEWVKLVPNNKPDSLKQLAPAAVSGTLGIAIGRVRPMTMGPDFINAFTIGDQLLWGAAEPLRRMLRIVLEK
jgi:aspartate-semialdehyde dehydrogenase